MRSLLHARFGLWLLPATVAATAAPARTAPRAVRLPSPSSAQVRVEGTVATLAEGKSHDVKGRKPRPCSNGSFLVEHEPLVVGDIAARAEAIVLARHHLSIGNACRPAHARLQPGKRGTAVRATWDVCAGLRGPVRLQARIDPTCAFMIGTLTARASNVRESFRADRAFAHGFDAGIFHGAPALQDAGRGPRPLAAVADQEGIVSRFIANELIFTGAAADLTALLRKYRGKVIASIPPAPVGAERRAATGSLTAPQPSAVVRLDSSHVSLQDLDTDAATVGLRGQATFSSQQGARLAALALAEEATGAKVALNFVSEGHDYLYSTAEQADASGVSDAFQWPEFDSRAWQFVAANGFSRRVRIAIIDGGFWLDSLGRPFPDANGRSDLPRQPDQFDVVGGGPFAGGPNPDSCTGGTPCPWHGNKSASVAVGALNNMAGAAGTGGQVADPILLKVDGSDDAAAAAVVDAMGRGADIISMSFGGPCNDWCRLAHDQFTLVDSLFDAALDGGLLLVASAGNDGADAADRQEWPCRYCSSNSGACVYCVGAYFWNADEAAPYSNFGAAVNIWAPTNIHAMPDGGSAGALTTHTGTSASCPYVAGVAAMVKAIDPTLDGERIKSILGNGPYQVGTASYCGKGSGVCLTGEPFSDGKVTLVLQPYAALVNAVGGYRLAPDVRILAPSDGTSVQSGVVSFQAFAADVNDGPLPDSAVVWMSDLDGAMGSGKTLAHDFASAPEGLRHVTVTGTNSVGVSSHATVTLTITCPPGVPVCNDRACCAHGACVGDTCCGPAPENRACFGSNGHTDCCRGFDQCNPDTGACCSGAPCGSTCCTGDDVCLRDGYGNVVGCCAPSQVCGYTCCPADQLCTDPHEGACIPCPVGQASCDPGAGAPVVCCPTGDACCPSGGPAGRPSCCTDPSAQFCCDASRAQGPDATCHPTAFCIQ